MQFRPSPVPTIASAGRTRGGTTTRERQSLTWSHDIVWGDRTNVVWGDGVNIV